MSAVRSIQIIEFSFKFFMQKTRQVRGDFRSSVRQPSMDDSPIRHRSVPFDEALFFQLVENGYHSCRTQVSVVGKGLGRDLPQIPNALQNNDLRDREPG